MSDAALKSQRRSQRVKVQIPVTLAAKESQRVVCTLLDLSNVGAMARVDRALEEMTLVNLQFSLRCRGMPEFSCSVGAAVVRCERTPQGQYEVGLYFSEMDDETRTRIAEFITHMSQSE